MNQSLKQVFSDGLHSCLCGFIQKMLVLEQIDMR
jgi:hypothetical protein